MPINIKKKVYVPKTQFGKMVQLSVQPLQVSNEGTVLAAGGHQ